jgi:hypothetical protein
MKTYRGVKAPDAGGQLHTSTTLLLGKQPPVSTELEAQSQYICSGKDTNLCPYQVLNPSSTVNNLDTVLTELVWHMFYQEKHAF